MKKSNTMKKMVAVIFAALVMVVFSTVTAWAGSVHWPSKKGLALGTGLAILGATMYHKMDNDWNVNDNYDSNHRRRSGKGGWDYYDSGTHNPYPRSYDNNQRNRYDNRRHNWNGDDNGWRWKDRHYKNKHDKKGHWEVRKIWVPPQYKKVWVEGHYNHRRRVWVSGHWKKYLVRDGYYKKEKTWVSRWN